MSMNGVVDYGSTMPERWVDLVSPDVEKQKKIEEFKSMSTDEVVDGIWNRAKKGGKT